MILEEETFEKFGYYPKDLTPHSGRMIVEACDKCGKIRITSKNHYHSLCGSCSQKRELNHNWKGGKIKRICKKCGNEFETTFYRINQDEGTFCTHSCSSSYYRRHQKSFPTHHTKPELIFEDICKNNNLDFHYVGDGSLWIGEKGEKQLNPDFIEANGKKICVEIMGTWWHSPLLNKNLREDALQSYREKHYQKYKWQSIFIWDTDILREDAEQFILNILQKEEVI